MRSRIIATVFVFLFVCFMPWIARGEEKKASPAVVIAPFEIGAAGKFSYLKDGLRNMLASRLATRDNIRIVDYSISQKELDELKNSKKPDSHQKIFSRLHADYLASGVLYSMANGVHLQITLFTSTSTGKPSKFTMQAENEEKIMSSLDLLAQNIAGQISGGEESLDAETAKLGAPKTQQKDSASEGMAGFQTAHPDRLYKKGIYAGGGIVGGENAGAQVSALGVRKSVPISHEIIAMAVGDVDGDGIEEIVVAAEGELQFYHFRDGRFALIAKAPLSKRLKIHALNLADLNKNGKMEIYISATDENTVSSLVAEWTKEQGLQILNENIHWYLRPLQVPGEGMVLAGQERGLEGNMLVFPGIYELNLEKGQKAPKKGKRLSLPDAVNLFDFVYADLNGDGQAERVVIDKNEKMLVYDQNNSLLWVSNEDFGGSKNYLGSRWQGSNITKDRIFVPTRIIAVDLNNTKKQDVVIARNKRETYSFFANFRTYSGGSISCMTWTGSAMSELWHTNQLPGIIVDYSFDLGFSDKGIKGGNAGGDTPQGRRPATLFLGQIPESTVYNVLLPTREESVLYSYQLDFKDEGAKKE